MVHDNLCFRKMHSLLVLLCCFLCSALAENVAFVQPSSYSQVRLTSTRRNGTYDSQANNLANHRIQVTPEYHQPIAPPVTQQTPSAVHQPTGIEVQSAVHDAIKQDAAKSSSASMAAYLANFYPQFSEVLQNKGTIPANDLQHLPTYMQTVVVQPPHVPDYESASSDQSEVSHSEEQAHEYQEEPSEMHVSPYDSHPSNIRVTQPVPNNNHYYVDGASDQHYHVEGLPDHDKKDHEMKNPGYNGNNGNEGYGNDHESSFGYREPNIPDPQSDRRVDSQTEQMIPTTTDCPTCRFFHEEMIKRQQQLQTMKTPPSYDNTLPHTDDMKETLIPLPVPSNVQIPESAQMFSTEGKHPNFTAPFLNEIFSITDAVIPQISSPDLTNSSQAVTQSNGFAPVANFQPPVMIKNQHVTMAPSPQGVPVGMMPQQFPNGQNSQAQTLSHPTKIMVVPASQQQLFNNQQLPVLGSFQRISLKPPPGSSPQNGGSFMHPLPLNLIPNDMKEKPTMNHLFQASPNRNSPNFASNQLSQFAFNQPQAANTNSATSHPGIHGPMGIPIPIPPKSVPAHSVMAPPVALPAPVGGMMPPRRQAPGIFDSIMNFFSGGKMQNRARSLDEDGVVLSAEDLFNETLLYDMSNITGLFDESLGFDEQNMTENYINGTGRNKRAIIDQLPDYLENLYKQVSKDVKRIASPLLPMLRDTFRQSFSQYANGEEQQSGDKERQSEDREQHLEERPQRNLWSTILDTYTKFQATEKPYTASDKIDDDSSKIDRLQELHSYFTNQRKNNTSKSTMVNYHPACAGKSDATYCLKDDYYPKSVIYGNLLRYKLFGPTLKCDAAPEVTTPAPEKSNNFTKLTCESPVQEIHPLRAKNVKGEWKIIVNVPSLCQQTVNLKKCHSTCIFCKNKEVTYPLIAYDNENGFHQDKFNFVGSCSCSL